MIDVSLWKKLWTSVFLIWLQAASHGKAGSDRMTHLTMNTSRVTIEPGQKVPVSMVISGSMEKIKGLRLTFTYSIGDEGNGELQDSIAPLPTLRVASDRNLLFVVQGKHVGRLTLGVDTQGVNMTSGRKPLLHIDVVHHLWLEVVGNVCGWCYFAAINGCLLFQIHLNWKLKSVAGLSLDMIAIGAVGLFTFTVVSSGLYFVTPAEQATFHEDVRLRNVIMAVNLLCQQCLLVFQCCIYERGEQSVSVPAVGIVTISVVYVAVNVVLAACGHIAWAVFLASLAFINLITMPIRNVPQVWRNYKRKSTKGWSIAAVTTQFLGAMLLIVQLILISANRDDWSPLLGNVPRFLLELICVGFLVTYMLQHWVVYRGNDPYDGLDRSSPYQLIGDRKASGATLATSSTDVTMSPLFGSRPGSLRLPSRNSSFHSNR